MLVVTGGAGFVGSRLVKGLNQQGRNDIIVVDNLTDGKKFANLVDCDIADYMDSEQFIRTLENKNIPFSMQTIFHQGACAVTTEWNGRYMMENNYEFSKRLLHYAQDHEVPFIYASSGAVYGCTAVFKEERQYEAPLNVYGYSKWLFDQYVLRHRQLLRSQVVGLRYFNVYGPHESHKGSMASVVFHWMNQLKATGHIRLFEGSDGYAHGEQRRDFVYVDDVIKVNLWLWAHPQVSGIFNVGTGRSRTFNELARCLVALHGAGEIEYIPFPDHLKGAYQSFTEADITKLRATGYKDDFSPIEMGLKNYYAWYKENNLR